jgi:predicted phosphodiesterase
MADQNDFLDELLGRFKVCLVNRYEDPALGFDDDPALRVFIPDLHWISTDRMSHFQDFHFNGMELFPAFFGVLEGISGVEVFQSGDRLDFWRQDPPDGMDADEVFEAITEDPKIKPMHQGLQDLGTTIVHGNHDRPLTKMTTAPEDARPEITSTAGGKIFLTHGHIWDQIEKLPDKWKAALVIRAENVHAGLYKVGPFPDGFMNSINALLQARKSNPALNFPIVIPNPTGAVPVAGRADVEACKNTFLKIDGFDGPATFANARDDFHQTHGVIAFGGDVRARVRTPAGRSCRLFVIGHTHRARLLVDVHPDGGPLVTMDCGAWIENCTIQGGAKMPSAQFGVQCGNEVRIYQLGPK